MSINSDVDELIGALEDVLYARKNERTARNRYDGYEWGWHGHEHINAVEEAETAFEEKLNAVITARVEERITALLDVLNGARQ